MGLRSGLLTAALALSLPACAPDAALAQSSENPEPSETHLLLDVYVNDCPVNIIGDFVLRGDKLFATQDDVESFGLVVHDKNERDHSSLVSFDELPHVTWRIDYDAQKIYIYAMPHCLAKNSFDYISQKINKIDPSTSGFYLNYDLSATVANPFGAKEASTLSGLFDARFFIPAGDFQTSFAAQSDPDNGHRLWRLDSSFRIVNPESMRRIVLGDFISRSLSWSQSLRIGGVQIQSDFSLQPDLITFPLPTLSGSTLVPSTLDILVNGNQVINRKIPAGRFEVSDIPIINGSGNIQMKLTDIFGRQQQVELPFYASNQLIRPGLNSYSIEIGSLRKNWGLRSWDYRAFAASSTLRHGVNQKLTLEAHAEATPGLILAGFGAIQQLSDLATLAFSLAGSHSDGLRGTKASFTVQHVSGRLSLGANAMFASRGFRDIAAQSDGIMTRRQLGGYVGGAWHGVGNLQLAYNEVQRINLFSDTHETSCIRLLNASFSRQIGPFNLQASAYRDFAAGGSTGAFISLSMAIGPKSAATVSASTIDGNFEKQFDAGHVADVEGDFGYQIHAASGQVDRVFAVGQYRASWGFLTLGAERLGRENNLRFGLRGSIIGAGGAINAANVVENSFAMVNTAGLPNIRVLRENREVGRTDRKGRLLVTDLRPYQANNLSIAVDDLPPEAVVSEDVVTVRPRERSGVNVAFDIRVGTSAILHLVDSAGTLLPLGSSLRISEGDTTYTIGHDGIAFLENLRPDTRYNAKVVGADGKRCAASFVFKVQPGQIADLGFVACVEQSP